MQDSRATERDQERESEKEKRRREGGGMRKGADEKTQELGREKKYEKIRRTNQLRRETIKKGPEDDEADLLNAVGPADAARLKASLLLPL